MSVLERIRANPELAQLIDELFDFDVTRTKPAPLRLPSGRELIMIAWDAADGFFAQADSDGPVLYASSEGLACLIAPDPTGCVQVVVGLPYWHDCLRLVGVADPWPALAELTADLDAEIPDLAAHKRRIAAELDLDLPPAPTILARVQAMAARTAPDYLPVNKWGESYRPY
jgi:hypothetical protein